MPLIGVYRGIVVSNTDPQRTGRVQVQVPSAGMSATWALACVPPGATGATYSVGATVIVAFEGGDSTRPVVLGRAG